MSRPETLLTQHSDLAEQGYTDQSDSDLIAACAPSLRIGIPSNNIPAANKRFAGRAMSALHPNRKETPDE